MGEPSGICGNNPVSNNIGYAAPTTPSSKGIGQKLKKRNGVEYTPQELADKQKWLDMMIKKRMEDQKARNDQELKRKLGRAPSHNDD
jgi:hypothetical protein